MPLSTRSPGSADRSAARVFLSRFFKSPATVGAVAPSSRFLARKMVAHIDWSTAPRIVEFGPGTGPFTREVLERQGDAGGYLGVERDPVFVRMLSERFPDAEVHHGSVEALSEILRERQWSEVDHIISGLPFASFPLEVVDAVLREVDRALRPGGTFTTFQYLHAFGMRSARRIRRDMRGLLGPPSTRVEIRNIPPAFVFTWRKAES